MLVYLCIQWIVSYRMYLADRRYVCELNRRDMRKALSFPVIFQSCVEASSHSVSMSFLYLFIHFFSLSLSLIRRLNKTYTKIRAATAAALVFTDANNPITLRVLLPLPLM